MSSSTSILVAYLLTYVTQYHTIQYIPALLLNTGTQNSDSTVTKKQHWRGHFESDSMVRRCFVGVVQNTMFVSKSKYGMLVLNLAAQCVVLSCSERCFCSNTTLLDAHINYIL